MLSGFWSSIGGRLADRWATVSAGALVYWLGGVAAWLLGPGDLHDLDRLAGKPGSTQLFALAVALLVVTGSGVVVQALAAPTIRAMEGYWPRWLDRPRAFLVKRAVLRDEADELRWQQSTGRERAELDQRARRRPENPDRLMPTAVGNMLRAAESHPEDKYGLDAVVLWPHLWLVLPDQARQEIATARAQLDGAARLFLWGLLFLPFAAVSWVAVPVGLAVAAAALRWRAPSAAAVYADLVEAAYDLYRPELYRQLRWALPVDPRQERAQGRLLTAYVWRGPDADTPTLEGGNQP